jgi:hypothetical protein
MDRIRLGNDRNKTNVTAGKIGKSMVYLFFDMEFVKKDSFHTNCYKLAFYITTA